MIVIVQIIIITNIAVCHIYTPDLPVTTCTTRPIPATFQPTYAFF